MNDVSDALPRTELYPDGEAPEGMILNAYGGYSVLKLIKPEHMLEDQVVKQLLASAQRHSEEIAAFRAHAFEEVDEFIGLLAEKYNAPRGGAKGNTTLTSFDGLRRVQVATGDFLQFGPELQVAKSLVDECLTRWSDKAGDELKTLVNDAFDVGKEGKLRIDRILALRRLAIRDETWLRAMQAIGDAVRVTHSKRYIRFYQRDRHDAEWRQVTMDMSRVQS